MKVFVDNHHSSLMRSLQLLFEERLGHELFCPIGISWFDEGYWKIGDAYSDPRNTAMQYLDTRGGGYDRENNLSGDYKVDEQGIYHIYDPDHDVWYKGVTLATFKKMKFDVLVASYIDHITPYWKLVQVYQSKAKLIHQMGNNWASQLSWNNIKNVMASTAPFQYPPNKNVVFYHQEIDPKLFSYDPAYTPRTIMSFVNILTGKDLEMFLEIEKLLPDYNFSSYGASCRDGSLPVKSHAEKLKQTQFVFHKKAGGDGFGHVIHSAFYCGKPPIVDSSQYQGQLAYKLMKDGETCVDIKDMTPTQAAEKIKKFSEKEVYEKMSKATRDIFVKNVDYDIQQKNIEMFLNKLK